MGELQMSSFPSYYRTIFFHSTISLCFFKKKQKNRCGEANMYMEGFRCNVTGSTSNIPVARGKPAVWCEGEPSKCTKGAKQLIAWNQLSGNNIEVEGFDLSGHHKSPGYGHKCGFNDGECCETFFFVFFF